MKPSVSQGTAPSVPRVLGGGEQAALWFSLGVGLLVIQTGAYLVPGMSTRRAFWAVLLGSAIGSGLLAWVAWLAQRYGRSSAEWMHAVFGSTFAHLPVLLNVLQLIGWATFELVIMRDSTRAVIHHSFGMDPGILIPTLCWGAAVLLLIRASMLTLVRRLIARIALPLVVASLLWLTYRFGSALQGQDWQTLWAQAGDGSMSFFQGIDLIIAMPVSWLPLVADYARHGRSPRGAVVGTWVGYAIANVWCYALGVLVITVIGTEAGGDVVQALLFAQGGLLALGLILVDELHNGYSDLYSASVSARSLWPHWGVRTWGSVLLALATACALVLPMHALEPFLLLLSSIFVPLFGVILGRSCVHTGEIDEQRKIQPALVLFWLAGIALYHALAQWLPQLGSALPTLVMTFALAFLWGQIVHRAG